MPITNGREQVFNEGIKNNDVREADTTANFLVTINPDGTHGKINLENLFGLQVKPEPYLTTAPITGINQVFALPVGFGKAGSVLKSKGELYKGTEWTQSGGNITILISVTSGNSIYVKPL